MAAAATVLALNVATAVAVAVAEFEVYLNSDTICRRSPCFERGHSYGVAAAEFELYLNSDTNSNSSSDIFHHDKALFRQMQENAIRSDFYWPTAMDNYEMHIDYTCEDPPYRY